MEGESARLLIMPRSESEQGAGTCPRAAPATAHGPLGLSGRVVVPTGLLQCSLRQVTRTNFEA
jgi:hypothetical protein